MADFARIIAARKQLEAMKAGLPVHAALGLSVGAPSTWGSTLAQNVVNNPIISGKGSNGAAPSVNVPTSAVAAVSPTPGTSGLPGLPNYTDQFKATTPGIDTSTNYNPLIQQGQSAAQTAESGLDTNASNLSQLSGAGGLGGVLTAQQGLAGQLQGTINGTGPNAAQSQFQQNTNQNIAQEAGTIESTKGINPALAAKMAADNGAAQQQAAAGTALTTQAQQQVAAQQQLAAQQQAEGSTVQGIGGLYSAAGGLQAQAGNLGTTTQGNAISGQGAQNNAINTGSLGTQGLSAGVASTNTQIAGNVLGAGLNAAGGAGSTLISGLFSGKPQSEYTGGEIGASHYAEGGLAATPTPDQSQSVLADILRSAAPAYRPPQAAGAASNGPNLTSLGSYLSGAGGAPALDSVDATMGATAGDVAGMAGPLGEAGVLAASKGAEVPSPVDAKAVSLAKALMAQGGAVPGKDAVPGKNSPKNDTVPAVLSPHEIVLPLSVTQSDDAPAKAAAFVEQLKAKAHPTYGKVLQARQALSHAQAAHKAAGGAC